MVVVLALPKEGASQVTPEEAVLQRYVKMLSSTRNDRKVRSLEGLLAEVRAMKSVLFRPAGTTDAIEHQSEKEFARFAMLAEGVIVNRQDFLIVEPDSEFFLGLANKYGRPADIAFFQAFHATFAGSHWPSYIQQTGYVSGCTDYSSGELVARYRAWRSFRTRFPRAYVPEVEEQMREIERQVSEGTCACGEQGSVVRELKEFVRAFPSSPVTGVVKKRLDAIVRGKADVQFHCAPG